MLLTTLLLTAALAQPAPDLPKQVMSSITPDHCRADIEKLVSFGTRHTLSDTESPTRGIGAARRWIKSELESISAANGNRLQVSFEEFDVPKSPRMPRDAHMMNVVAVLPGADPDQSARRYYVVGHYDSRNSEANDAAGDAPGANDDGSGTTVVIECARALAPHQFPATIVFLATVAEEQGLYGAKHHADEAKTRGEQIVGVLSNDIVGDPLGPEFPRPPGDLQSRDEVKKPDPSLARAVRVFSEGLPRNPTTEQLTQIRNLAAESDSPSRQLARYVADVAAREQTAIQPKLIFRLDRFLRGGDHSSFNEAGFPAVRFTVPLEDYTRQHQNVRDEVFQSGGRRHFGDTPDYCDFDYIANVARLNAATLVHLSGAPPSPANARVITAHLANDTTLRWDKSPGAVAYEVVYRDTTAPTWDHSEPVGGVTEFTIDHSKDDYFFGVRAVGPSGFKSPVAFAGAAAK